jgi:hypothetical protein
MTTIPFDASLNETHLEPICVQTYAAAERGQNTEEALDYPLRALSLIWPGFERHSRFEIDPKTSSPPAIFTRARGKYCSSRYAHTQMISVRDNRHAEGSPGVIFKFRSSRIDRRPTDVYGEIVREVLA